MALIVYDGFDHYASAGDMEQRFGILQYYGFSPYTGPEGDGSGRTGVGRCLAIGSNQGFGQGSFYASLNTFFNKLTVGFAFNFTGGQADGAAGATLTVVFQDALTGATNATFYFNSLTGQITLLDASGAGIITALNCFAPNGWFFYELSITSGKPTGANIGSAAIRVNNQTVPSFPDLTGLNTQGGGNAGTSRIYFVTTASNLLMDDMYIADGTTGPGSYVNNGFLGDVRSATLFPVGNNSVQWVPAANANWQEVSEHSMDSDASYNRTATAGAQDSFNFQALDVDVNEVLGIQVTVALRKEDAGARTVAPVIVIGGVSYVGTAVSVDVSYLYITSLWPINPSTGVSWTAADVNALAAGYVVVT